MKAFVRNIVIGAAAGLVAAWIKSKAEPPLQKLGERYFPPTPGERQLKGADVTGHPENMPPVVLAERLSIELNHRILTGAEAKKSMVVIHYGFGAAVGAAYCVLAGNSKGNALLNGISAGAVCWAATHGSTIPMLHLQARLKEMPASWWVWELGSHLVYGVSLEQARRLLNGI